MKSYSNFTHAYYGIINDVYNYPEYICSPRGLKIKEKIGYTFRINNIRDRLPYIPHRNFSLSYMFAELIWYFSGCNSTKWISKYSSMWNDISDDGATANSAYGSRIFHLHKYQMTYKDVDKDFNQWNYVKEELTRDPDSRRAVVHIRMPQDSLLASKDVPCTLTLQFFIREGALHQVVSMRSSDVIFGIAYDIPAFTMMQEYLANQLNVECGSYTHVSNSLHVYEKHFDMCEKIIAQPFTEQVQFRCKPMNMMPKENMPIKELFDFEYSLWNKELPKIISEINDSSLDNYWKDWLYGIARFIAIKRKDHDLEKELEKKFSFQGFRNFKR